MYDRQIIIVRSGAEVINRWNSPYKIYPINVAFSGVLAANNVAVCRLSHYTT
jgi:hypothetical protein